MRCAKTTNSTNPESGQGHTWGRLKKGLDSLKHERQERVTGQVRNVKRMTTKCYRVLLDGTPAQKRKTISRRLAGTRAGWTAVALQHSLALPRSPARGPCRCASLLWGKTQGTTSAACFQRVRKKTNVMGIYIQKGKRSEHLNKCGGVLTTRESKGTG